MSKKETNTIMVHEFIEERFNHFLGRVMTQIETLGLGEKQEKAFKDIIKQEIWYLWEHPWGTEEKESLTLAE